MSGLWNFGHNVHLQPRETYTPRDEAEVLQILERHAGARFRAVGRLHAWSHLIDADDILLDLRLLDHVAVLNADGEQPTVDVGAGCQIKRVVAELQRQGNFTLPSLGLIDEQAIAGATATGTHGSGRHCLSQYIRSVRLATYDPVTGKPTIRVIDSGEELAAARCSLGTLGIITAVHLAIRPQYRIEEHFRRYATLEEVLNAEQPYDLQQFYLVPWRWDFFAQHRREVDQPRSRLAWLYRLYWVLGMDVGLHLIVLMLTRWLPHLCTKLFFRRIMPLLVPRRWKVVDRSDRQLTMQHELFRHIEIELFVRRSKLPAALEYVGWFLRSAAGSSEDPPSGLGEKLAELLTDNERISMKGCYRHQYPLCVRKVLPDDTLMSMASGGDEPAYALSFVTYARPDRRDGFFLFAELLSRTMDALFDARPHWGKHCPLTPEQVERLYPQLKRFREIRKMFDPDGRFLNGWTERIFANDAANT